MTQKMQQLPLKYALAMIVAFGAMACSGRSEAAGPKTPSLLDVSGRYVIGFEANTFVPCGATRGWWVASLDSVPALHAYVMARGGAGPVYVTAFVHWRGVLSDSGRYGHLGASPYEFAPRAVIEVRDTTAVDCR